MQTIKLNKKLFRKLPTEEPCRVFFADSSPDLSAGTVSIISDYGKRHFSGYITQVYTKPLSELSLSEANSGGYQSVRDLTYALAMIYTRFIKESDRITVVSFTVDVPHLKRDKEKFEIAV